MSYSQIGQEDWVLNKLNFKKNGFFVEAGACDGIELSNTYFLEKNYFWNGICVEPNPYYFSNLLKNRSCATNNLCLYSESDKEVEFSFDEGLGGIIEHFNEPDRQTRRMVAPRQKVITISLNDLLKKYNSPKNIDYISLDTEGTELEILKAFNFNEFNVKLFTIEHNIQYRSDGMNYLNEIIQYMKKFNYRETIVFHDVWFEKII